MSRNLDIAPKSLKTWLALYDAGTLKASIGVAKLTPDQLRIRELERELAIAREERDLLKKATINNQIPDDFAKSCIEKLEKNAA